MIRRGPLARAGNWNLKRPDSESNRKSTLTTRLPAWPLAPENTQPRMSHMRRVRISREVFVLFLSLMLVPYVGQSELH
jgi:hypothetical protein